jgi:glycosyltransferase involved in cell wall biosynthesis
MNRYPGRRIAICFHHLGPYHRARLRAANARERLVAIEFRSVDDTHGQWQPREPAGFEKVTLFDHADLRAINRSAIGRRLAEVLAQVDPEVVVVPGWSHPAALAALAWCSSRRRPAVLMSASTVHDERRRWWREAVKRRVVAAGSAALAGGAPQCAYLHALGIRDDAIFAGYDAVDNAHFAEGAARVRTMAGAARARLGLPERFFLASCRLVAKKNLLRLLDAYARYRQRAGANAWGLVILGDGELRVEIEGRIAWADLAGAVILPGFRQYDELPAFYGLAGAFVHASTTEQWGLVVNEAMAAGLPVIVSDRCGCAPDLVRDGVNGFTFDPSDVEGLTGLMYWVAAMTDEYRQAMGRAGQAIIAEWGPERFAEGLMQAVDAALSRPPPTASLLHRGLLWALAHRR